EKKNFPGGEKTPKAVSENYPPAEVTNGYDFGIYPGVALRACVTWFLPPFFSPSPASWRPSPQWLTGARTFPSASASDSAIRTGAGRGVRGTTRLRTTT